MNTTTSATGSDIARICSAMQAEMDGATSPTVGQAAYGVLWTIRTGRLSTDALAVLATLDRDELETLVYELADDVSAIGEVPARLEQMALTINPIAGASIAELAGAADLTVADLEAGYGREDWNGYGYLGERSRQTQTASGREDVAAADAFILDVANSEGWTADELFDFVNSKNGRWVGDAAFGGHGIVSARSLIRRIR